MEDELTKIMSEIQDMNCMNWQLKKKNQETINNVYSELFDLREKIRRDTNDKRRFN